MGNKTDLANLRKVTQNEAYEWAKEHHAIFYEVSSALSANNGGVEAALESLVICTPANRCRDRSQTEHLRQVEQRRHQSIQPSERHKPNRQGRTASVERSRKLLLIAASTNNFLVIA